MTTDSITVQTKRGPLVLKLALSKDGIRAFVVPCALTIWENSGNYVAHVVASSNTMFHRIRFGSHKSAQAAYNEAITACELWVEGLYPKDDQCDS